MEMKSSWIGAVVVLATRISDLLGSLYVANSGWVLFLAYSNLFGNKDFEEEEATAGTKCYEGQSNYVSGPSDHNSVKS